MASPSPSPVRSTGSISRRMIGIAALWISVLLLGGGVALDRVLSDAVTRNFDDGMNYVLTAMIAAAEIGPDGEVLVYPEFTLEVGAGHGGLGQGNGGKPGAQRCQHGLGQAVLLGDVHEDRLDLAAHFGISQTPTVLITDASGEIKYRVSGAPKPGVLAKELSELGVNTK